jgi:hypothetical protein
MSIILAAQHGSGAYPFPVVVAVLCYATVATRVENRASVMCSVGLAGVVLFTCAFASYSVLKRVADGEADWTWSVASPPDNRSLMPEGVVWVADRLSQSGAESVFDLSNNGVINGLLRLPSSTRFTYPVYAGPQHEQELVDQLRVAAPPAVVYSSTYWSYAIDGRSMRDRFPALDAFILRRYPIEESAFGYSIRYTVDGAGHTP